MSDRGSNSGVALIGGMCEMLTGTLLFPATAEIDLIDTVTATLGFGERRRAALKELVGAPDPGTEIQLTRSRGRLKMPTLRLDRRWAGVRSLDGDTIKEVSTKSGPADSSRDLPDLFPAI